jgi:hypothetical protein
MGQHVNIASLAPKKFFETQEVLQAKSLSLRAKHEWLQMNVMRHSSNDPEYIHFEWMGLGALLLDFIPEIEAVNEREGVMKRLHHDLLEGVNNLLSATLPSHFRGENSCIKSRFDFEALGGYAQSLLSPDDVKTLCADFVKTLGLSEYATPHQSFIDIYYIDTLYTFYASCAQESKGCLVFIS